jgi:hypothetical protein
MPPAMIARIARCGPGKGQWGKLPVILPTFLPIFPGHGSHGGADWTAGHGSEYESRLVPGREEGEAPIPAIRLARRPTVRANGLAARAGLVLLAALASVLVAGRTQVPPAVRTSSVGRVPTAVVVDARTRHVFVANMGNR